jgi:iron-sulfur cluster assembly accessory protein
MSEHLVEPEETEVSFEEIASSSGGEGGPYRNLFSEKDQEEEFLPVRLTDLAATKVLEIFSGENIPLKTNLRVSVKGGGCAGFTYDMEPDDKELGPMDRVLKSGGVNIIVDEMSLMYLAGTDDQGEPIGTVIDYIETLQKTGFTFKNGNVRESCGCGSSFSV